jgi:hypothetical protein
VNDEFEKGWMVIFAFERTNKSAKVVVAKMVCDFSGCMVIMNSFQKVVDVVFDSLDLGVRAQTISFEPNNREAV